MCGIDEEQSRTSTQSWRLLRLPLLNAYEESDHT